MTRNRFTVASVLVALFVGWIQQPALAIAKVNAWNLGIVRYEAWRAKASSLLAVAGAAAVSPLAWLARLCRSRFALHGAAAALALLLMALGHEAVGVATLVAGPVAAPTKKQLQAKRTKLITECEALRGEDGEFADDDARESFDAKMKEVDQIDQQLRKLDTPAPAQPAPTPAPATESPDRNAIIAAERQRVLDIQRVCATAKLDAKRVQQFIDEGTAIDEVRRIAFDALSGQSDAGPVGTLPPTVQLGEDARDKWVRGAMYGLLARCGMAGLVGKHEGLKPEQMDPAEFRGMSLIDLAREALTRRGVQVRGLDRMDIAGQAMTHRANYQTTSDFAILLENTMHRILRAAYALQVDTWSRWCGIGTVSDFRAHNWYRIGSLTEFESLNEHGEFKNKGIPDGEKSTYQVTTKGNIIPVTRQVIVNDDLGAMTRLTSMMGRAAKLSIEKAVYALLGQNSGLGPTQSDSQPLFHSNRANVGSGAAISVASIDADRVILASQKDPNGVDFIDLRPDVLLVPIGIGGEARVINDAQYDPDTANKLQRPNKVRGLFRDIVDTPRLSGTRRYMFADRNTAPVVLVSFLEGQQEPVLETRDGWRIDGVELKGRLDFGVDVVDYRGAVTNAGQ